MAVSKMKRSNATVPKWDVDKWTHRPSVNGKQRKIISHKDGKAGYDECIRKENTLRAGIDAPKTRLNVIWTNYLEERKERLGAKSDGYIKAECYGRLHILPRLKNKRVAEITSQDWQNILNKARSLDGKMLSKKTLMNIRGEITAFCKYAMKAEVIQKMPFDLTIPKQAVYKGKDILQMEDVRKFLNDEPDDWWFYCWQLQLVTGLRPGEALGLQRRDVKDGLIIVRRSINAKNDITQGKNNNALRTIVQNELASAIIENQLKRLAENKIDLPWLFPDQYGVMSKPNTVSEHFKKYAKKYSMHITQYCLRHTLVSIMQNIVPLGMLQDYIGHSPDMDTLGVYGHKMNQSDYQTATIITGAFNTIINKSSLNLVSDEKQKAQDLTVSDFLSGAANGT